MLILPIQEHGRSFHFLISSSISFFKDLKFCIGTGDCFLNITPIAQILRATINKWDLLKLKSFYKAKDTVNKTKQKLTDWEDIFTNSTSDRGLISKIYEELKKLDTKKTHNPILKNRVQT